MKKLTINILLILLPLILLPLPCFAMKQIIVGAGADAPATGATEYSAMMGGNTWLTEARRRQVISTAGTLRNLRILLSVAPGAGKSYTFTVRINGAGTALSFAISNTDTQASDTDSITVAAGDLLSLECVPAGTPTAASVHYTIEFEGDTANESIIMGGNSFLMATSTQNHKLAGFPASYSDANTPAFVIPTGGTIKNLYFKLDVNEAAGATRSYTLWKNGASTALTCSISGGASTCNDTSNTVAVVAGDTAYLQHATTAGTPSGSIAAVHGLTFVATTDGESLIMGGDEDDTVPAAGVTEYLDITRVADNVWSATETDRDAIGQDDSGTTNAILKNLYVYTQIGPGNGNSLTFTARQDVTDTNISCAVTGTGTTCNDTANTYTMVDFDLLSMECTTSAARSNFPRAFYSVVCYIAPSAGAARRVIMVN